MPNPYTPPRGTDFTVGAGKYDVIYDFNVAGFRRRVFNGTWTGVSGNVGTNTNDKHVLVIGNRDAIDTGTALGFYDCASVTIIGGYFQPPAAGWAVTGSGSKAPGTLTFTGVGEVYLEGVVVDNRNLIVTEPTLGENGGDAIFLSARFADVNTKFTAQNVHIVNVRGLEDVPSPTPSGAVLTENRYIKAAHGDFFQTGSNTQGKAGECRFYNVTASGNYQGFFLDPQKSADAATYPDGGNSGIIINRMNLKRTANYGKGTRLIYFYSSSLNYTDRGYPVSLTDFYVEPLKNSVDLNDNLDTMIWPNTVGNTNFTAANGGHLAKISTDTTQTPNRKYAEWPGFNTAGKVLSGRVWEGAPSGGDFCPIGRVGLNYTVGTDLTVPALPPGTDTGTAPPQDTSAVTVNTNLIAVNRGAWTKGGNGSVSLNLATGDISITGSGTGDGWARRSVTTKLNTLYQLSWHQETTFPLWRIVGATNGGAEVVALLAGTPGENKVEFSTPVTTTWLSFQRTSTGQAIGNSFILQEKPPGASNARRMNGKTQYAQINAVNAGLRIANHTMFIGGFVRFTYAPAAGAMICDFGNPAPTATANSAGRIRLFYDPLQTKWTVSSNTMTDSSYREHSLVRSVPIHTWVYIGFIAQSNADVTLVFNKERGNATIGTAIPPVNPTDICRVLTFGARQGSSLTNFAPATFSRWTWCSGWIPTQTQLDALADGAAPYEIAGFAGPTGTSTHFWPFDGDAATETSSMAAATLSLPNTAGQVVGPVYTAAPQTQFVPFPFDFIMT